MQEWLSFKELIAATTGLERDALHILASLPLHLGAALTLRRPLASSLPWLLVFLVELANESASGFADGAVEEWELSASLRDIALVMTVPTFLLLICRFAPSLVRIKEERAPVRLVPALEPAVETIVDADFEEIGPARDGL